jgi:hypothetical protein
MRFPGKLRLTLILLAATSAAAAIGYQMHTAASHAAPTSLSAYVPQNALLTLESPDFASLLNRWSSSPESKSWLASDNYSVFQNSRLFGRLTDAQTAFADAAGIPANTDLLHQIAGKQSIFAWYDIGKLEFLYITRISPTQAAQSQLLQSRSTFQLRHAGSSDFYIRTKSTDFSTVAFAQVHTPSGDLLLLATREDLIANALNLIAATPSTASIQQEPWFADATSALAAQTGTAESTPPALHMVLNLDRIVPDPHFRSYWIQRNITWTKQFRAAASDLYLSPNTFREERILLPKSTLDAPASPLLTALAELPPTDTGVFRATATHDTAFAITAIQEKLLGADTAPHDTSSYAPDPSLDAPTSGSSADLETSIDTLPPVPASASTAALAHALQASGLDAVLTLASAETPSEKSALWIPIHSGVVLHTTSAVTSTDLAAALQQTLRGTLTASNLGISFQSQTESGTSVFALTGPRPLFFAIPSSPLGNLIFLTDDQPLLLSLLHNLSTTKSTTDDIPATTIAVFHHTTQRAPYLRLTSLIDGTNNPTPKNSPSNDNGDPNTEVTATPTFFNKNIGSLSSTFAALDSERVLEQSSGPNLRQTVIYTWKAP